MLTESANLSTFVGDYPHNTYGYPHFWKEMVVGRGGNQAECRTMGIQVGDEYVANTQVCGHTTHAEHLHFARNLAGLLGAF